MKKILMSIQPKWCEKIFNGEKTYHPPAAVMGLYRGYT